MTAPVIRSEAALSVIAPALVGVVLVLAWEIACRAGDVPVFLLPKPSDIALKLASDWPTLLRALGMTLRVALQAFAASIVLGTADRVPVRPEPHPGEEPAALRGAARPPP